MAGITKVHGGVVAPVTLHGGYQMSFYKIADSASGFTADTLVNGKITVEGGFAKAIRLIQTVASIVYIGTRADGQFVVAVDGATAQPTGPAYDTDTSPTFEERLEAVMEGSADFGNTITVTDISGLAAGVLA